MSPRSRFEVAPLALLEQVADRPDGVTIGRRIADLSRHYGVSESTIRRLYYSARKLAGDPFAREESDAAPPPSPIPATGPPYTSPATPTLVRDDEWNAPAGPVQPEHAPWEPEQRAKLEDLARLFGAAGAAMAEASRLRVEQQRLLAENGRLLERVERLSDEVLRAREGQPPGDSASLAPTRKVLDTNVIIDGRIVALARGGFMEGTLIIPGFILNEIKYLADSRDPARRNAGRRGLDNLRNLQDQSRAEVITYEDEEQPGRDLNVDNRLLRFAQRLGSTVVTNDYNLCRVAEIQRVNVLDINALYRAAKPGVAPFEEVSLMIVEEGKKPEQGVGYLEDGTMIVVDEAHRFIGQKANVIVTQILPTSWGTIAFAKIKAAPAVSPYAASVAYERPYGR
jgi:rRNA-processing protein FCF1